MTRPAKAVFFCKDLKRFIQSNSFFQGSSNDNCHCSRLFGGAKLFFISAASPGFLCHHIFCLHMAKKLFVHFLGKRSLHCNEMFPFKSVFHCFLHCFFCGKHTKKAPALIIGYFHVRRKFLASGGDEDISFLIFQIVRRLLNVLYPHCIAVFHGSFPQHPHIRNALFLTHFLYIFCHFHGKRMGGVNDKLCLAPVSQFPHSLHIQSAGENVDIFPVLHLLFSILCRRKDIYFRCMSPKKFRYFPPLCRSCKNHNTSHFHIPLVLS